MWKINITDESLKTMTPLQLKIFTEYEKLCNALMLGKEFDYDHILDALNFLEMGSKTSNPKLIQSYLINK